MKKPEKHSLDAYFAEGDSWANDRNTMIARSRRAAWIVAIVAVVVAVCEAFALVALAPLKTVVPYTLMVDRQTGFVQTLKPLEAQSIGEDAALTRSFLVQYVIAREGFDIDSLQSDYRKVAAWSVGSARAAYIAGMQASNPDSPIARYPRAAIVDVTVRSVTSIGPKTALVRYDTRRRRDGARAEAAEPWVAVVRYSYSAAPMSEAERFINPLGFQVVRYRTSRETLPASQPAESGQASPPVPQP